MSLLDFAREHGAVLHQPISPTRIASFEHASGLELPDALREFYTNCGGTDEFTDCVWRIWPFDELTTLDHRVRTEPDLNCLSGYGESPVLADYLAFIDALIEAPIYAVCARRENSRYGEVISLAGDSKPFLVGPIKSIEKFIQILQCHWKDAMCLATIIE
jgi:hypothetical protein